MAMYGRRDVVVAILAVIMVWISGGGASAYVRPPAREMLAADSWLLGDGRKSNGPEQVHISMVGEDKMRISWVTKDWAPTSVEYGTTSGSYNQISSGEGTNTTTTTTTRYNYLMYKSGYIHHTVIGPLRPSTVYYYRCASASNSSREFSFKTPPTRFPIKFVVIGDLGQTGWTRSTLQHISKSNYDMLLLPGDLSYADFYQPSWDSFGRLVEPLASQRPWMVTQGNHEVERIPLLHRTPFTSYNARWRMPFEQSGSPSNLYYSFNVAGVHVIMLGSYTDFGRGSDQYKWLQTDLGKIDRKRTPWVLALVHAPWYNTNHHHQGERESVDMRKSMERLLYEARVDVVFAGHVHAYERFSRVYEGKANRCGPLHVTIGDGGNREGLATGYMNPPPKISIFRESSFGHGQLEVVNATHARWTWHRNQDDAAVVADSLWLTTLSSEPSCFS